MNTSYHFNGETFTSYADMANNYYKVNGYYPGLAYKTDGANLYYK